MKVKNLLFAALFLFTSLGFSQNSDVVDIAIGSEDHTTLVAAVKAANLVKALKSEGPITVFAPTNSAFDALPEGVVANLLKPENQGKLKEVLVFHVIAGDLKAADVIKAIKDGGGKAEVKTLGGAPLTLSLKGGNVVITDGQGRMATVVAADLKASNGVVHVLDTVLLP
jgi:uncharacterized surface protein with fasciclin (FAS1) repeats